MKSVNVPRTAALIAGVGVSSLGLYLLLSKRTKKVAHIGDSLTAYTVPSLIAAYENEGVQAVVDAFGGRAILQKLPKDPRNGVQAVQKLKSEGFNGDWVIALGTNDTANVSVGSSYSRDGAIDAMMNAIDPNKKARVMWVNAKTTTSSGPWSNANMQLWNAALDRATSRWPNLVIYDWAADASAQKPPFNDGIHHTVDGYAIRNKSIAKAYRRLLG